MFAGTCCIAGVRGAAAMLAPGGRFVLLDLRMPDNWLCHLAPALVGPRVPNLEIDLALSGTLGFKKVNREDVKPEGSALNHAGFLLSRSTFQLGAAVRSRALGRAS